MKNLMVAILGLVIATNTSLAAEKLCTANIKSTGDYVEESHFVVDCGNGKYDAAKIFTMVFLPLPYNWKGVALKKLNKAMTEKGLKLITKIKAASLQGEMFERNLLIFGTQQDAGALFCLVARTNEKSIGLGKNNKVSDLSFECSAPSSFASSYSGLSDDEIEKLLAQGGLVKTPIQGLYKKP